MARHFIHVWILLRFRATGMVQWAFTWSCIDCGPRSIVIHGRLLSFEEIPEHCSTLLASRCAEEDDKQMKTFE